MPEEKSINLTKSISPINFTNLNLINLRSYSKVTSENALVDQSVREVISNVHGKMFRDTRQAQG